MNKKMILLILVLAMVLLFGGASALYTRLGQEMEAEHWRLPRPSHRKKPPVPSLPRSLRRILRSMTGRETKFAFRIISENPLC